MARLIGQRTTVSGVNASFMILAAVLITCHLVFIRTVLGQSTIWQTEAVLSLMIRATMIALAYVQKIKGYVGADLIPTLLGRRGRRVMAIFTLVVTGLMLNCAYDMRHFARKRGWKSETVWAVPLWIPDLSVPVGFGLFLFQIAADLWMIILGKDSHAPVAAKDRRH